MAWNLDRARAWWSRGQGLGKQVGANPAETVGRTGWIRTLGGAEAYLALAARSPQTSVEAVDAAVAERALQVLPAVRGCIYLVPAEDAAIALRVADQLSRRRTERELAKAGISEDELEEIGRAVVEQLARGPLQTRALGKALPEGLVRSLGEAGKKVGLGTTLPPALRQLELAGRLVRQPVGNRLDHERYAWTLPATSPLDQAPETDAEVHRALARRFIRWAGPATRKGFAGWSGLGQRDAQAALEQPNLQQVEVEAVGTCWIDPGLGEPSSEGATAWLGAMDNLFALRSTSAHVVHPAGHDIEISVFGRGGPKRLAEVNIPLARTLAVDGQVVGLWERDPATHEIVTRVFAGAPSQEGRHTVEQIFETLGHAKAFSLDSDKTLARRAAVIQG